MSSLFKRAKQVNFPFLAGWGKICATSQKTGQWLKHLRGLRLLTEGHRGAVGEIDQGPNYESINCLSWGPHSAPATPETLYKFVFLFSGWTSSSSASLDLLCIKWLPFLLSHETSSGHNLTTKRTCAKLKSEVMPTCFIGTFYDKLNHHQIPWMPTPTPAKTEMKPQWVTQQNTFDFQTRWSGRLHLHTEDYRDRVSDSLWRSQM